MVLHKFYRSSVDHIFSLLDLATSTVQFKISPLVVFAQKNTQKPSSWKHTRSIVATYLNLKFDKTISWLRSKPLLYASCVNGPTILNLLLAVQFATGQVDKKTINFLWSRIFLRNYDKIERYSPTTWLSMSWLGWYKRDIPAIHWLNF